MLDVRGAADEVRATLRNDGEIEDRGRGRVRVRITAASIESLFVAACFLATRFSVRVREPAELRERVELLATRLTT